MFDAKKARCSERAPSSRALALTMTCVCVGASLAASLTAQQRIVVDASNGVGTNFTTLPPAIAAAKDGDWVLVRPGRYEPFVTSKPLNVVAEVGAVIDSSPANGRVEIKDLKVGQRFLLAGFIFDNTNVMVQRCRGLVNLSGLATNRIVSSGNALTVEESDDVVVHGCALKYAILRHSNVQVSDCIFATGGIPDVLGTPGIRLIGAKLSLTACTVVGGSAGLRGAAAAGIQVDVDSGTGARVSSLRIFGDASTAIAGGVLASSTQLPALQDRSQMASLELDPRVALQGGADGFATTTMLRGFSLSCGYSFIGHSATLRLVRKAEQVAAIFMSTQSNKVSLPGLGAWYLDLSLQFVVAATGFPNGDSFVGIVTLPALPALQGLEIGYQAVGVDQGAATISNPVLQVLR